MILPVILAGGKGSRLWPISTAESPKSFSVFVKNASLFQHTLERVVSLNEKPLIVCGEPHRFLVAEQLAEINRSSSKILLEPMVRDTAAAIVSASIYALHHYSDPILLFLPADHYIGDESMFCERVHQATVLAEQSHLVLFGVEPSCASSEYGYIQASKLSEGSFLIEGFKEKPNLELAEQYIQQENYFWNCGIFLARASVFIDLFKQYAPSILNKCEPAVGLGREDGDFFHISEEAFSNCPKLSIDYAVLERATDLRMLPLNVGWSDVGDWGRLAALYDTDDSENVKLGNIISTNSQECFIKSDRRPVVALGLSNHVVVDTENGVLVAEKNSLDDLKSTVDRLEQQQPEAFASRRVVRPWGCYEILSKEDGYCVKRISVKPGASLSLQKHRHRSEHWIVLSGRAHVTSGSQQFCLSPDQSAYIPSGTLHRLQNLESNELTLIEVQTGSYLGEDDIQRFDDQYGRVSKTVESVEC